MHELFQFDNTYEKLPPTFFKKVNLNPASNPSFVYLNEGLAEELGLDAEQLREHGLPIFAGSAFPEGASQISQAYMGHQFGHLAMLGDGRAVLVGEILSPKGARFDVQLKGSGRTPFSRGGDGLATHYYMLKEYLFSESLHALGIPSSRSLAIVQTGDPVYREEIEKGAVLTRVASSHIRVGTFQYALYSGDFHFLKALANYTIRRHYPELVNEKEKYLKFFDRVLRTQTKTVAKWMSTGFVHGVMNTDNTSISGETFDYGPCAFIDTYDLDAVYSSIDRGGRYRYGKQPEILLWNLTRFGETLLPLIDDDKNIAYDKVMGVLQHFGLYFEEAYYKEMTEKLGLFSLQPGDTAIVGKLLHFMQSHALDYTNTFVDIRRGDLEKEIYQDPTFQEWKALWDKRRTAQTQPKEEIDALLQAKNPIVVARNYWVGQALADADNGDYALFDRFLKELQSPYTDNPEKKPFTETPENFQYRTYCGT